MSGQIQRTRVLSREPEEHPVAAMLGQAAAGSQAQPTKAEAGAPQPPTPDAPSREAVPDTPAAAPTSVSDAPTASEAPENTPTPEPAATQKPEQVNYRLDPALIDELRLASLVYSHRKRKRISQNKIVDMAIRAWLEEHGPWDI